MTNQYYNTWKMVKMYVHLICTKHIYHKSTRYSV